MSVNRAFHANSRGRQNIEQRIHEASLGTAEKDVIEPSLDQQRCSHKTLTNWAAQATLPNPLRKKCVIGGRSPKLQLASDNDAMLEKID